ncbi:MAG: type II toxin-antitoxin system RelE/ParE family toxin [Pseudomonadota bacterium]
MRIVISPLGLGDLRQIVRYIAADNPRAARRLVQDLERFCTEAILANPEIGKPADEIMPGLRIATKRNYRICYRVSNKTIEIARVIHGARLLDDLFSVD